MTYHLVFDTTDPKSPRFIELEDSTGHSISAGEWRERKDGYVELVLPAPSGWQDIATAPRGELLLYSPEIKHPTRGVTHPPRIVVDRYPVSYPRQPTHWMPLPSPPKPLSYEGEQT